MGTGSESTILHVDMDAFFASVEQRDHPEWKGRPLVVGAGPHERGVVAAASYEARKFGIHSAMPSREAGRRCPHAIFTPPDMARYSESSRRIFNIFERFTPLIEPLSIDEAFLDVTGSLGIFGSGVKIAGQIRAAIKREEHLTASVGIASNMFLAKIASDMNKPDGITIVPSGRKAIREFLAPLPVRRLWGVGKVTGSVLEKAGLLTIGDIQKATPAFVCQLVGQAHAEHLKQLSDGEDHRSVETESEAKSISRENTFAEDCADPEIIRSTLLELIEDVGRELRDSGKYAKVVCLKIRWKGFDTITRQVTLPAAACDDFTFRTAALELLAKIKLVKPVRLVGFGVASLAGNAGSQLTLFGAGGRDTQKQERLSRTVDQIRRKLGESSIRRLSS